MDKITKEKRSWNMSRIKGKGTRLETKFKEELKNQGLSYRINNNKYFGKPDFLFKSKKVAIFIDSCFWHNCPEHSHIPLSNTDYWKSKLSNNLKRDLEVNIYYLKNKWNLIRIWEHDIKTKDKLKIKVKDIKDEYF